jgi:transcriptional regulator with XRE-family HTH domain
LVLLVRKGEHLYCQGLLGLSPYGTKLFFWNLLYKNGKRLLCLVQSTQELRDVTAKSIRLASPRTIAALFGVSRTTVWRWDQGLGGPTTSKLEQVSALTRLSLDELSKAMKDRREDLEASRMAENAISEVLLFPQQVEAV